MQDSAVCPYYDHNEDVCDVGCGYISSHDASMIIKFCSCHFQDCQKYRELTDRFGRQDLPDVPVRNYPAPEKPSRNRDNIPVFGLFCYGIAAASYAIDKLPVLSISLHLLAIIIMFGAIGQISAGLNALKSNPLRAIAFTGFGLFWLSILALDILPKAGYGSIPGTVPMMGYFVMWGMFSLVICQGFEQLSRPCRAVFALATAFLLMYAMAQATASTACLHIAALLGLASSLPGIAMGLLQSFGEAMHLLQLQYVKSSKIRS